MNEKKESIMKMLEMAGAREIEIVYYFVLHLVELRGVEDAAPYETGDKVCGTPRSSAPTGGTDCHTVVRDGSQ